VRGDFPSSFVASFSHVSTDFGVVEKNRWAWRGDVVVDDEKTRRGGAGGKGGGRARDSDRIVLGSSISNADKHGRNEMALLDASRE
jgi:hypothetical protein